MHKLSFTRRGAVSAPPTQRAAGKIRTIFQPYLLIAPALAVLTAFMFYPLFYTLYLSFFDWNLTRPIKKFVGFGNYVSMFTNPRFPQILGNTLFYIFLLLLFDFAAPYVLSFLLSFVIRKGKAFYKGTIFLPSVISLVVGTMIFVWILNPITGPAAQLAKILGISVPIWTNTQGLVIVVFSIMTSWKIFGYNFIVVLAGISGIPSEVIEAARLDGIPTFRIFFSIVIPMSSATGIYVLILAVVQGMQQIFTPINMITQGGPDYLSSNLIYNVYQEAFAFFKTGTASAYAILMMVLFGFLLYLEFKYVEKGVYYEN